MNFIQRYNIAREDADVLDNVQADETVDVSEVIAAEEELEEFNEASDQASEDLVAIEEAEAVVDELEGQVEKNEAILANPEGGEVVSEPTVDEAGNEVPGEVTEVEPISSEVVQASQEAYMNSLGRLGYKFEDLKSNRLSVESIVADNVTALRLSTEGIKEMISSIIAKIKEIFVGIGKWLKKMALKIASIMPGFGKKAAALEAKVDEVGDIELTPEEAEAADAPILAISEAYGGNVDEKAVTEVLEFSDEACSKEPEELAKMPAAQKLTKVAVENGAPEGSTAVAVAGDTIHVATPEGEIQPVKVEKKLSAKQKRIQARVEKAKLKAFQKSMAKARYVSEQAIKKLDTASKELDSLEKEVASNPEKGEEVKTKLKKKKNAGKQAQVALAANVKNKQQILASVNKNISPAAAKAINKMAAKNPNNKKKK